MPRKYSLRAGQTMGTQKPRILPWLISQLDRGEWEGVAWLGESRTRFRIPWKHGLRQDAQQEDFGIFQVRASREGRSLRGAGPRRRGSLPWSCSLFTLVGESGWS